MLYPVAIYTVPRSKITDCPGALHPFYPRTGHVSSPKLFTQSACVIASFSLPPAQYQFLIWVDISGPQIWDWLVQCENLPTYITHRHQVAALALTLCGILPHIFHFRLCHAPCHVWWIAACPLPNLFDPQHLFH